MIRFDHLKKSGAVYGENRIGYLTYLIMKKQGYKIEIISEKSKVNENSYDYIIETLPKKETFDEISKSLKKNGILILKSRLRNYIEINLYNFLKKEIIIESLYYHDFDFAIEYAINNFKDFVFLFGKEYTIENWKDAFNESISGDKKIFFKF